MGDRCMGIQTLYPFHFRYGKQVYRYMCSHPSTCIAHSTTIHKLVNQVNSPKIMCMQSWAAPCARSCFGISMC